jgi:flavin reductase (DIM6/NTAB) family NADH-FMN oxidoreductase RutF
VALIARVLRTVEVGDHAVAVGQVERLLALTDRGAPLVRYDGRFGTTVPVA